MLVRSWKNTSPPIDPGTRRWSRLPVSSLGKASAAYPKAIITGQVQPKTLMTAAFGTTRVVVVQSQTKVAAIERNSDPRYPSIARAVPPLNCRHERAIHARRPTSSPVHRGRRRPGGRGRRDPKSTPGKAHARIGRARWGARVEPNV